MAVEHCSQKWKTRYCGECGARIDGDSPLSELVDYLEKQIASWENRPEPKAEDPAVVEQRKEQIRDEITKRKLWIDMIQAGENAVREIENQKRAVKVSEPEIPGYDDPSELE